MARIDRDLGRGSSENVAHGPWLFMKPAMNRFGFEQSTTFITANHRINRLRDELRLKQLGIFRQVIVQLVPKSDSSVT